MPVDAGVRSADEDAREKLAGAEESGLSQGRTPGDSKVRSGSINKLRVTQQEDPQVRPMAPKAPPTNFRFGAGNYFLKISAIKRLNTERYSLTRLMQFT